MKINYGFIHINPETIRTRLLKRGYWRKKVKYHLKWANYVEKDAKKYKVQITVSGDENDPEEVVKIFENWIKNVILEEKALNQETSQDNLLKSQIQIPPK